MAEERLFPALPEDLKALSDDERGKLLADHEAAKDLILEDNAEFLEDLTANEIIAQLKQGVEQIKQIKAVSRGVEGTSSRRTRTRRRRSWPSSSPSKAADEDSGDEDDSGDDSEEEAEEEAAAAVVAEETVEEVVEPERGASGRIRPRHHTSRAGHPWPQPSARRSWPSRRRAPRSWRPAASARTTPGRSDRRDSRDTSSTPPCRSTAQRRRTARRPSSTDPTAAQSLRRPRGEDRHAPTSSSPRTARSPARTTTSRRSATSLPEYVTYFGEPGGHGGEALVASGGLCAPLTPIYSMPNFATEAEPVWDCAAGVPRSTRRRERPDRDLHRGHHRRPSPPSRRRTTLSAARSQPSPARTWTCPDVHGDGRADHRALP